MIKEFHLQQLEMSMRIKETNLPVMGDNVRDYKESNKACKKR